MGASQLPLKRGLHNGCSMLGHHFLIVGGDSSIGSGTASCLWKKGHNASVTTRRPSIANRETLFLDMLCTQAFETPSPIRSTLIAAAVTTHAACEASSTSRIVNIIAPEQLACSFFDLGTFVVFLSTEAVFGGDTPWPREDAPHAPKTAYAEQKHEAELRIAAQADKRGCGDLFSIIRLTKVIGPQAPPFASWIAAWEKGEYVTPFSDLTFSPLSVSYAAEALASIMIAQLPGIFHLSGAESMSYAEFAFSLANTLGISRKLVRPITSKEAGVNLIFMPQHAGLDMTETTKRIGLTPQPVSSVLHSFVA